MTSPATNAYTRNRVTQLFRQYDRNGDGYLSVDEIGQSAIDNTNRNKDGRISFEEGVLELQAPAPRNRNQPQPPAPASPAPAPPAQSPRDRIIASFRMLDRNNDGFLGSDEVSVSLVRRADTNNDGRLTLNEVLVQTRHPQANAANPVAPQTSVVRVRLRNGRVVRAVRSIDADGNVSYRLL